MTSLLTFFSRRIFKRSPAESNNKRHPSKNVANSKFIGTPLFNVLLMVALGFGVSGFFRFLEWRRMNAQTQIQINDSENISDGDKTKDKSVRGSSDIFGGEVFDTSRRLRETGSLGFAVCLSILDEARSRRQIPGSINGLINAVISRDLMPPEIEFENNEVRSPTSVIYIRYQPEPLQLEFVSVPKDARFGPALMLRFPLTSADGKNIAYFQSSKVENINLPAPFAPSHEIIKSGWTLEAWRGMEMNGNNNQDFAKMLAEEQENLKNSAGGTTSR